MKKIPLHIWIFTGMLLGIVGGIGVRFYIPDEKEISHISSYVRPVGAIFLRMVYMMIIPLVLSALSLGVAGFGDYKKLGRIGFKMLKYTLVVTGISVLLGVGAVTLIQPGKSLSEESRKHLIEKFQVQSHEIALEAGKAKDIGQLIVNIVPKNPVEDMARAFDPSYTGGGILAVMFFAVILGIAMSAGEPEKMAVFKSFMEALYDISMRGIGYAMMLAPIGIFALLFTASVEMGWDIIKVLLQYVVLVLATMAIHLFVTYSVILRFFSGMKPSFFFRNTTEVMITAFSTSSSNATLPTAIRTAIEKLKLPKDIAHFVLTVGSTGNQNGTALYEGITILFLAQCFNIQLSTAHQVLIVIISVLAGLGSAGVPGGSLPVMMLILISLGIPGESIALIFGVDRILDMSRTVLNVTGDITAAAYISHSEANRIAKEAI